MASKVFEGGVRGMVGRYSDIALAALVIGIVGMMIVPLPTAVLDMLLTLNFTIAVTLLMVSLYIPSAIKIAAFPSILLITTLFRLALNVSSTRLILLNADAGEVIASFGDFVVQGNYVVGAVIFLILTLIQFIVVAKGAERVSEVGARFTLDAMPGKQMSIDADLRAGAFDLDEARRRRGLVQMESKLYGSMDGAMKFVKGDAIAGVIMTAINIVAGIIIGVMQKGMSAGDAAQTYTLLTIGDGLVSQIPALLIATTAGIIVTRVSSGDDADHLGADIFEQLLAQPKAMAITSGLLVLLGLMPGLPTGPFLLMAAIVGSVAYGLMSGRGEEAAEEMTDAEEAEVEQVKKEAKEGAQQARAMVPAVVPLGVELGVGVSAQMRGERLEWLESMIPTMREGIFYELGIKAPGLRLRADSRAVGERAISVMIDEVPVRTDTMPAGRVLVDESPDGLSVFGVTGTPAQHPTTRQDASWVAAEDAAQLEEAGYMVWDAAGYALLVITAALRENAAEFITLQQVRGMLDQLETPYPVLVQEVVPKVIDLHDLTEVMRRLAEEGITLRQLPRILQVIAERGRAIKDPIMLTEEVRAGLCRYITHRYSAGEGELIVYLVDREIEEMVASSVRVTPEGSYLALPPDVTQDIMASVHDEVDRDLAAGREPILLTDQKARRYIRRLVSMEIPQIVVLSFQEIDPAMRVQPLGRITVGR
jgi:type III secretion protein V